MKNVTAYVMVLLIGGACMAQTKSYKSRGSGSGQRDGAAAQPAAADGADPYSIIVERNIFMKDRGPRKGGSTPKVELTPEQKAEFDAKAAAEKLERDDEGGRLVLTGVALEDGRPVAFFEGEDGSMKRAAVGDVVADRKITDINLDQVHFEREGKRAMTVIGKTLTGKDSPPPRRRGRVGSFVNDLHRLFSVPHFRGGSLAEKMKARREAELKGKTSGNGGKDKELEKKLKDAAEKEVQKDLGKDAKRELEQAVKDEDRLLREQREQDREP